MPRITKRGVKSFPIYLEIREWLLIETQRMKCSEAVSTVLVVSTESVLPLRLQKGCRPDQVPLGKQILSAEPYSVCPTAQVKRTLLRTLKLPASLVAWAGVPGSPQVSAESPATRRERKGEEGVSHRRALLSFYRIMSRRYCTSLESRSRRP